MFNRPRLETVRGRQPRDVFTALVPSTTLATMKRNWFALLFALATASCHARADVDSHYLALGDSYTCGQSVPVSESYPFQLSEKLKAAGNAVGRPTVVAVTGWTTDELAAGIRAATLNPKYDLVTLLIGVNDQYRHRSVEQFRPQFVELVNRAIAFAGRRAGHVVVISIPDWGVTPFAHGSDASEIAHEIDAFNDAAKSESSKAGVHWVDVTAISRTAATQPALGADDGLHPSGTQYARWVDAILPMAKTALQR